MTQSSPSEIKLVQRLKSIELKNKVENIGAQIVKQAAIKTADQAGDGTTTSTLTSSVASQPNELTVT